MSKIVYTRETTNDDIGTVETFYEAQADELSGEALSPYFESSESVTKSLNEGGNIEFSVNADIVQKVERAILTPADAPSEDVVPVVDSTNAVSYKPLSEIGGGGGGETQIVLETPIGTSETTLSQTDVMALFGAFGNSLYDGIKLGVVVAGEQSVGVQDFLWKENVISGTGLVLKYNGEIYTLTLTVVNMETGVVTAKVTPSTGGGGGLQTITFTDRPTCWAWLQQNASRVLRATLATDMFSGDLVFNTFSYNPNYFCLLSLSIGDDIGEDYFRIMGHYVKLTDTETTAVVGSYDMDFTTTPSIETNGNLPTTLPDAYWGQINVVVSFLYY